MKMKKFFKSLVLGLTIFATGCSQVAETTTTATTTATTTQAQVTVNKAENEELKKKFDSLLATNKDTIGHISIPGTKLSEPVVQTNDNTTYLDKTFDGQNVPYLGSIFMDMDNSKKFDDKLTWLFGHVRGEEVNDTRMFAELMNYTEQEYFEKNPYVVIETPEGKKYYEAQLFMVVSETTDYYKTEISEEAELQKLLDEVSKDEAVITKKKDLNMSAKDKYLVLSTCLPKDDTTRYNLYLKEVPTSELSDFLEKNKEKLAQVATN